MLERAFKDETAGLVTRADFIQKRQTIAQRLEADQLKRKRMAEDAVLQVRPTTACLLSQVALIG